MTDPIEVTDEEIEAFIRESLNQNYELLKLENGHALAADVRDSALQQALLYWHKLKEVAKTVSETEVRLNLPGQTSSKGRKFGIEGVVDIVRDDEKTVMYDIKTHEEGYVRTHLDSYEDQLNIYAYIWQNLRGQRLDETAVIATAFPEAVKEALADGDERHIAYELDCWDPLVKIQVDPRHIDTIIQEFGQVVDQIENGDFVPASLEKLKARKSSNQRTFATDVCRNCDARFSCDSYRRYAQEGHSRAELALRQYLSDYGTELDLQSWLSSSLEYGLSADNLD